MTDPSPIEKVLAALEAKQCRAKREGNGWRALCPAHGDKQPSLSIGAGDDGRVLLKCHAGCPVEAIVAVLGLQIFDLFPKNSAAAQSPAKSKGTPRRKPSSRTYSTRDRAIEAAGNLVRGQEVARWPYHRADGSELFDVVRFETHRGKTFRPICQDGDGWQIGDPPGPLPLYRLPELHGAARVWLCEGEKTADAAGSVGLVATTSAHGAKSPHKTDWAPLAGRDVVILPDHDDGGRGYARTVAGILSELNPPATVRIVELPGLPPSGDLVDFIEGREQSARESIRAEIEALAEATQPLDPTDVRGGPVLVRLADVEPEELAWLWPGRIPLGKLTLLAGDPGLGKSMLTLDIAARVSRGASWPDSPIARSESGSVILLSAEDDIADTIRPRLDSLLGGHQG